jgi:hypothetical protein
LKGREKMKDKLMCKEMEDIEYFIEWLISFYQYNDKKKDKVIKKISKQNKNFASWLNSVKDFNVDMQLGLINQLRYSEQW